MADFDRSVKFIVAQPFLIRSKVQGVVRRHIPDYLLLTDADPVLVDVKPREQVNDTKVAETFAWVQNVIESLGWRFEIASEQPPVLLDNVRFLAGYRRPQSINEAALRALRATHLRQRYFRRCRTQRYWCRTAGPRSVAAHVVDARSEHRSVESPVVAIDPQPASCGMTWAGIRIGIGTRVMYDGEVHVVTEWLPTAQGTDVVLRGPTSVCRVSLVELVSGRRARLLTDLAGPEPDDDIDPAAVVLGSLSARKLKEVSERAAHLREVLTGFRSGSSEAAGPGEPRAQFDPSKPLLDRYAAKAAELGVAPRTDPSVGGSVSTARRGGTRVCPVSARKPD